jgi:hypothetical protein
MQNFAFTSLLNGHLMWFFPPPKVRREPEGTHRCQEQVANAEARTHDHPGPCPRLNPLSSLARAGNDEIFGHHQCGLFAHWCTTKANIKQIGAPHNQLIIAHLTWNGRYASGDGE